MSSLFKRKKSKRSAASDVVATPGAADPKSTDSNLPSPPIAKEGQAQADSQEQPALQPATVEPEEDDASYSTDPQNITRTRVTTTITKPDGSDIEVGDSTHITHMGATGLKSTVGVDGTLHLSPVADSRPASTIGSQETIEVRKPRKRKPVRTIVSFEPRDSHFDRFNELSQKDQFRGFYTLFWIGMLLMMLNTLHSSYASSGQVISMTFATLFSRDAWVLAISDGVLVASLFLCVPFIKIVQHGWLRYFPVMIWVQHAWQAAMLGCVIQWAQYREWPWVQSGFFVLHTLSMMMKIHSYMAVNGNLADSYYRMKRIERMLEERVFEVEGEAESQGRSSVATAWLVAVQKAGVKNTLVEGSQTLDFISSKTQQPVEGGWWSLEAQRGTSLIRPTVTGKVGLNSEPTSDTNGSATVSKDDAHPSPPPRDPHPLSHHPDEVISEMAHKIETAREDFISHVNQAHTTVRDRMVWPYNVTVANFWDYLLVPTLVYDLEYPRTASVRLTYVFEKTLATFGTFFVIYVITEHWIMPHQPSPDTPLLQTFLQLALPMMMNVSPDVMLNLGGKLLTTCIMVRCLVWQYLLIFYIMFECICNAFAEMTRFADREFYQDWWNATSMDVFSRRWNKPVHSFLLRHVYASTISGLGVSKTAAMFLTFLLSSLLHELVMAIVSGKVRGYLFALQMAQLPLIVLGQVPFIKRNETLGNLIFWIGLMIGFPLLNIGYLVY